MVKIAIIVDGDWTYPIYRDNGSYKVDFGGSVGMCGPFSFPNDTKAISYLQNAASFCTREVWGHGGNETAA